MLFQIQYIMVGSPIRFKLIFNVLLGVIDVTWGKASGFLRISAYLGMGKLIKPKFLYDFGK